MPINRHSHLACLVSLMSDGTFELEVLYPVDIIYLVVGSSRCSPGSVVD